LSRGQLDTLRHLTIGLGNEEIAKKVKRTKRAVEWHIRHLNQQLDASGRERLAMIGRDAGLHCFGDQAWQQILRTRPARRHIDDEETPEHAHEPADLQGSAVA
jgi:DNA-binding CsgD family transcriptional regulator